VASGRGNDATAWFDRASILATRTHHDRERAAQGHDTEEQRSTCRDQSEQDDKRRLLVVFGVPHERRGTRDEREARHEPDRRAGESTLDETWNGRPRWIALKANPRGNECTCNANAHNERFGIDGVPDVERPMSA
jgi:hypothetical protein